MLIDALATDFELALFQKVLGRVEGGAIDVVGDLALQGHLEVRGSDKITVAAHGRGNLAAPTNGAVEGLLNELLGELGVHHFRPSTSFERGVDCILSRLGVDTPSSPTNRRSVCEGLSYAFRDARRE